MTPELTDLLAVAQIPGGPGMPKGMVHDSNFPGVFWYSGHYRSHDLDDHETLCLFEPHNRIWLAERATAIVPWCDADGKIIGWTFTGPSHSDEEQTMYPTYTAALVAAVRAVLAEKGAAPR